ncbi:MAG: YbjN domain-containing protein [Myxococcota bacterium]|nr:YbjN domain-containing protein [Myxococcota bacterium]MDW8361463.1 YbjN domain-containing protein [Myxococcales bacterium]
MTAASSRQRLRLDDGSIRAALAREGWPCERIHANTWRSHFRGQRSSFPFLLHVTEGWLSVAVAPYLRSPKQEQRASRLYRRLLELNHTLLLAKFSIDDDLDVVLSVDYPTAELDHSELRDAIDVLAHYADRHYDELRALAMPERSAT